MTLPPAAKQSRRLRFPEVLGLHTTAEVAVLVEAADAALLLHEAPPRRSPRSRSPTGMAAAAALLSRTSRWA
ncbi:MAG: hypothetical protein ACR2GB_05075 [Nocardioidaceae bacterium]